MRIYESPGTLKRYRKTAWEHQQTFLTASDDLPRFVNVILSTIPSIERAKAAIEEIVFAPRGPLRAFYQKYTLPPTWMGNDLILEAEGAGEARELLHVLLKDWVDFFFVTTPKRLTIYADHDEYITFLAHRKGPVSAVTAALKRAGFKAVEYVREF